MTERYEDIIHDGRVVGRRLVSDGTVREPRHVTRLAFWNRFAQAERVGIDLASIDDPATTTETRQQAASLRDLRTQVNNATFIDLDRPDTRAGVERLETAGLIGVGRAAEIPDAPVQPHELPQA
jgi:hypothetical protein